MSRPLRIAVFLGAFPVVSETFIVRQMTGLIDLGHEVDIYADIRSEAEIPLQPEVEKYHLLERATFMDMPPESAPWEMPVLPVTGRTWLPGTETSVHNVRRIFRALPELLRCLAAAPRMTFHVLDRSEYSYRATSLSGVYRLAKLLARPARYDMLHAHFGPVANSFRFARKLWRVPLVVSFHGYDVSAVPRGQGEVYRKLFATADCVTANSDYMIANLMALGCPEKRIRKLNYGIDPAQFSFKARTRPPGPVRIISVGRLVEKKGIEFVIRAVAELVQRGVHLNYDVVGDGPLHHRLRQITAEHGLNQVVTFHGALAGDQVRALLERAHIFALASVRGADGDEEGTPVSLLEAQAVGLPVISTRHSGIPEIVRDGESGFLLPERDVAALAGRLSHLMEHPEIWPVLGRNGRAWIERSFTIQRCNAELVRIYEDVLSLRDHAKCR